MASHETSSHDLDRGLWSFDLLNDEFTLPARHNAADNASLDPLQASPADVSEDAWWAPLPAELDIGFQEPVSLGENGQHLNDFTSLLNLTNDASSSSFAHPHRLEQNPVLSSPEACQTTHPTTSPDVDDVVTPPKIGTRFTRESIRILKSWLAAHKDSPYPDEAQKRRLQERTGLNRTQLMNWLANARRRNKSLGLRTASSEQFEQPRPISIPRPPTPAFRDGSSLNPLERWVESPPEHEPASAFDIARAVASNSSFNEESAGSPSFDPSGYPHRTPSAGSVDTSRSSGGSFSSANSYGSQSSLKTFEPFRHARSRRRKRAFKRSGPRTPLSAAGKTFQCTFCTETFGRKYDWQRHENSLHLPLERWICAPAGPCCPNPTNDNLESCVFCGLANPSDQHIESHHYSECQDRAPEERTFNRKDHLRQHLRLFHNVSYSEWSMQQWRVPTPNIRSRCGFCHRTMTSWEERADHLANHFKLGKTMADWDGDWGFDLPILQIIENAIPPAYELIKLELAYFMQKYFDNNGNMPTIETMQLEACRIILASKTGAEREEKSQASWLEDLILSNQDLLQKARLGSIRSPRESRLSSMKINGKIDMFEGCAFESQLQDFVRARTSETPITDHELQQEACRVVVNIEKISLTPSDFIATWLARLIHSSTDWLYHFRQRMTIPQISEVDTKFSSASHDYAQLDLTRDTQTRSSQDLDKEMGGLSPPTLGMPCKARSQTEADFWLSAFHSFPEPTKHAPVQTTAALHPNPTASDGKASGSLLDARSIMMKTNGFFLGGPNFYRWIAEELHRWAIATMSPHNPAQHVPTDEEIQHYARWIAYNDGDPLNQTVADNPYWLAHFKRKAGIAGNESGDKEPG
ncbi:uncharacterized protein NECHADRAFT_44194 [Fusarium vanettenii 77-13-4]|uniref:Homeobox domain-containing protein n=1 Tax=Fusarium vanettenii (strain ATCC MYA-4622 / CBS 123669 / FGSC 9596 / NRRL 45880 / 77-13-4) TaxID=660122 RepID=C7Z8Z1_FUSV7|nr:uncharacterized protein NECHADRAFT_44194 [Fusarium vanettenii 77-13-4]EEU39059.1 hypothetical protein NECHADRAFT_44194 [Fusarium vanettenii 77-13-4]